MATPNALADAVRERRKSFRLTQTELAEIAGVSPRFVYDVEAGKDTVALDRVVALTRALGIQLLIEVGSSE